MRLPRASIRPVGRPIGFTFNGNRLDALAGETVAAALSAGITVVTANGYTLCPAVGPLTAAAVLHGETIDPRYRLERFQG